MDLITVKYNIDSILGGNKKHSIFTLSDYERFDNSLNNFCSLLLDCHHKNSVHFNYLQIRSSKKPLVIEFPDYKLIKAIQKTNDICLVLSSKKSKRKFTFWIPSGAFQIQYDHYRRISENKKSSYEFQWEFFPYFQICITDLRKNENNLIIPFIVFEDNKGEFLDELSEISTIERDQYRKSDWFYASKPSDIWNYLINGSIYDPRTGDYIGKRFKCQQCAYAWWNYFGFLHKKTGKKIYSVMQDEIAFAVLMDLSPEGEWGHGFWSDEIETHARFHIDGIHLLLSQFTKSENTVWSEAAKKGMDFVFQNLTETFEDGSIWFLHDTIEHNQQPHIKSTIFGKSLGNSLCINTHVQALTAISRFRHIFPEKMLYIDFFDKGIRALRTVLDYQPANIFYKPLSGWIRNCKIAESNNLIKRKIKTRLQNKLIKKIYWFIARRFPRIVHPNGFIERDLTLSLASDRYHVTNIKDLLMLYALAPSSWLKLYIINGTFFLRNFIQDLGLHSALQRSPYYIEFVDILFLYGKLIEPIPPEEISALKDDIYSSVHGNSLDYDTLDLIHLKRKESENSFFQTYKKIN